MILPAGGAAPGVQSKGLTQFVGEPAAPFSTMNEDHP
jgi:hypothetical protein